MRVLLRTRAQAAKVAAAGVAAGLSAVQVLVEAKVDGGVGLVPGRQVEFSGNELTESIRACVEPVTVLYEAVTDDGFAIPTGWRATAAKFEVEWPTDPGAAAAVRSHVGARRFAYNWALGQVRADMDARKVDPTHASVPWNFQALRNRFNQVKDQVAPWWAENSKEAYASGIRDLTTALSNWDASKRGVRKGKKVGFPKPKRKNRDSSRVRFTTGSMRFEPDRRHIVLPRIGPLRSKENTRRVARHTGSGRARILSMTLSEQWDRLFVSVNYAIFRPHPVAGPAHPDSTAGVDLGLRDYATITDTDDHTVVVPALKPLHATMTRRRQVARQMSRRIPGSQGWRSAKATLTRLDRRAVNLRREAAHQLTTSLVRTHGQVVIEDLDLSAMKRSMGRRAFRRSVSDLDS